LDFILREAGYETKVQGYDFMVGKTFVGAMDEALKHSRLVFCLLSPAYLDSRWCGEEWQAALVEGKLFPLRIAECGPDGLLGQRAYVDLVGVAGARRPPTKFSPCSPRRRSWQPSDIRQDPTRRSQRVAEP